MSNSAITDLNNAEKLLYEGKYNLAMQIVKTVEEREEKTSKNHLLSQILKNKLLIKIGRYFEALELAERNLQKCTHKCPVEQLDVYIIMIECLERLGRFDQGLETCTTAEELLQILSKSQKTITENKKASLMHIKGTIYARKGDYNLAIECLEEALKHWNKITNKKDEIQSLNNLGNVYILKGDFDQALQYHSQCLKIRRELNSKRGIAQSLYNIGLIYTNKSDFDQALECYHESLRISEKFTPKSQRFISIVYSGLCDLYTFKGKFNTALSYAQRFLKIRMNLGVKLDIVMPLYKLGSIYLHKGDLVKALVYLEKSLSLSEELDVKLYIVRCLDSIGLIYKSRGDLKQALNYHERCLVLSKEIGSKIHIAYSLSNIGLNYWYRGELDQALTFQRKALALSKKVGEKTAISNILTYLGGIFWYRGDLDQALAVLERSLALNKEIGSTYNVSYTLLYMTSIAVNMSSLIQAQGYIQQLHQINDQEENKLINQAYRIAKALVLKTSTEKQKKDQAKELLKEMIKEEAADQQLIIMSLFNLCDLLIDESELENNLDILQEVRAHINRLTGIAKEQESHWLLVGTYILQAKVVFLELQQSYSAKKERELENSLKVALNLAEEKKLFVLSTQGHLLLSLFFLSRSLYDEAEEEILQAQNVIEPEKMPYEQEKIKEIQEKIQNSKKKHLEATNSVIEKTKQNLEQFLFQREFNSLIDDYLKTIKNFIEFESV